MQSYIRTTCSAVLFVGVLGAATIPAWSQDKPANNMEIVHEKLKADKKLIVSKYMELTESEAKNFWPVYEEYQADLQKIDQRLLSLLQSYAADYRNKSLTDEKAQKLLDADYYPPVRRGDVYRLLPTGVQTIVIIDGVFHSSSPLLASTE